MVSILDIPFDGWREISSHLGLADLFCCHRTGKAFHDSGVFLVSEVSEEVLFDAASSNKRSEQQLVYLLRHYDNIITSEVDRSLSAGEQYIFFYGFSKLAVGLLDISKVTHTEDSYDKYCFFAQYYSLLGRQPLDMKAINHDSFIDFWWDQLGLYGYEVINLLSGKGTNTPRYKFEEKYGPLFHMLGLKCPIKYALPPEYIRSHLRLVQKYGIGLDDKSISRYLKLAESHQISTTWLERELLLTAARGHSDKQLKSLCLKYKIDSIEVKDPDPVQWLGHYCLDCLKNACDDNQALLVPHWRIMQRYRQYPIRSLPSAIKFLLKHTIITKESLHEGISYMLRYKSMDRNCYSSFACQERHICDLTTIMELHDYCVTDREITYMLKECGLLYSILNNLKIQKEVTLTNPEVIKRLFFAIDYAKKIPVYLVSLFKGYTLVFDLVAQQNIYIITGNTTTIGINYDCEGANLLTLVTIFVQYWARGEISDIDLDVRLSRKDPKQLELVSFMRSFGFSRYSYREPDGSLSSSMLFVNERLKHIIRVDNDSLTLAQLSTLFNKLVIRGWRLEEIKTLYTNQYEPEDHRGYVIETLEP